MATAKPLTQQLRTFLIGNLGKQCMAPLTGTDTKALHAAVHIAELYNCIDNEDLLVAFRIVVNCMQEKTRELAYHAIAMVSEWHYRDQIWNSAGLKPIERPRVCAFEPGGSAR